MQVINKLVPQHVLSILYNIIYINTVT